MKLFYLHKQYSIRHIFTALLLLTGFYSSNAQSPTVNISAGMPHSFCGDSAITIPFTVTGAFNPGNIFSIELSDPGGGFSFPATIARDTTTGSGSVIWHVPGTITLSNNYAIRIVASNPSYTSATDSISISLAPVIAHINNNGPICSGDSLKLSVNISGPDTANTFKWTGPKGYVSTAHNPFILSADTTRSGTYTVVATAFGCASFPDSTSAIVIYTVTPFVSINPGPADTICAGTSVTFTDSFSGAGSSPAFQWYKNNSLIGGATSSVYTTSVLANNDTIKSVMITSAGCKTASSASYKTAMIVHIIPAKPSANNNGPVCNTDPVAFSGSCATPGVSYKWTGPRGFLSTLQNPTISVTDTANAGKYILTASLNGCTSPADTDTLVVYPSITPFISFTSGALDTICQGDTITFNTTALNAGATPTYTWKKNGTIIGGLTTSSYTTDSLKDGDGITCIMASSLNCPRPSNVSYSALVTVKPLPSIVSVLSNSPLCSNDTLKLNATASDFSCSFIWTGPAGFTSTLPNPEIKMDTSRAGNYYVKAILNGCESAPFTVPVAVTQSVTPDVTIWVTPGDLLLPNATAIFTAVFHNGGSSPALQWKKNGFSIPGATDVTFATSDLLDSDVISVTLTSNATCASPPRVSSNKILMRVSKPAVIPETDLSFYPNPNSGMFAIKGTDTTITDLALSIYNSVGQQVYHNEISITHGLIYLPIDIRGVADGVYFIHVITNRKKYSIPLTIKH